MGICYFFLCVFSLLHLFYYFVCHSLKKSLSLLTNGLALEASTDEAKLSFLELREEENKNT